jgi:hypothetical protein
MIAAGSLSCFASIVAYPDDRVMAERVFTSAQREIAARRLSENRHFFSDRGISEK